MEISLTHSLTYTTTENVPIPVIARSLIANEVLIQNSLRVLDDCFDDFEIHKITVSIREVSNGSPLKGIFAVGLFLAAQEKLEQEVPELIQKLTGIEVSEDVDTLVTVLVILVAIYLIDAGIERLSLNKKVKKLKAEYKDNIKELSKLTKVPEDKLDEVIKDRFGKKQKTLFKKALDFFEPAKSQPKAEIVGKESVHVTREAISEIPSVIDFEQADFQDVYEIYNSEIEIHRADIDYQNQGWVAIIREISDKRRKLILGPNIGPATLYGKTKIIGDVTVVEERQSDGDYLVKEYHLSKVIEK